MTSSRDSLQYRSPADQRGFTQVSNVVLEEPSLSTGAKVLFALLCRYAHLSAIYPGQETLAKFCGVTTRTIHAWLKQLTEAGLVSYSRRGQGQSNIYYLESLDSLAEEQARRREAEKTSGGEGSDRKNTSDQDRKNTSDQDRKNTSDELEEVSNKRGEGLPPPQTSDTENLLQFYRRAFQNHHGRPYTPAKGDAYTLNTLAETHGERETRRLIEFFLSGYTDAFVESRGLYTVSELARNCNQVAAQLGQADKERQKKQAEAQVFDRSEATDSAEALERIREIRKSLKGGG